MGFGAQCDVVDARGRLLPIWCQEQGHGRGLEPLSTFLGAAAGDPSGDWHTSYTCVPWLLTSRGRALLVEDPEYLEFDLRAKDQASVRVFAPRLTARVVFGRTPLEQVEALTEHTGRMAPLPAWTQRGPILRSHGGAEEARAAVRALRAAGGEPAGLWIEDWPGTRETLFGTRMWWNWVVDEARYPDWKGLVRELREDGVRVLTFVRTRELLQRWVELNAFTSLLRLHATNRPESNHQWDGDEETKAHFVRFCKVFAALSGYREQLMAEAEAHGWPAVRHPLLHHPDDPEAWRVEQQFLLGEDLMVAPVVDEGADRVEVWLPAGRWVHLWSGEAYGGGPRELEAPLGRPAVLYREGSAAGAEVVAALRAEGVL